MFAYVVDAMLRTYALCCASLGADDQSIAIFRQSMMYRLCVCVCAVEALAQAVRQAHGVLHPRLAVGLEICVLFPCILFRWFYFSLSASILSLCVSSR